MCQTHRNSHKKCDMKNRISTDKDIHDLQGLNQVVSPLILTTLVDKYLSIKNQNKTKNEIEKIETEIFKIKQKISVVSKQFFDDIISEEEYNMIIIGQSQKQKALKEELSLLKAKSNIIKDDDINNLTKRATAIVLGHPISNNEFETLVKDTISCITVHDNHIDIALKIGKKFSLDIINRKIDNSPQKVKGLPLYGVINHGDILSKKLDIYYFTDGLVDTLDDIKSKKLLLTYHNIRIYEAQ